MTPLEVQNLIALARDARRHAHAPYSGFRVGAAALGESGSVHTGCNIENASYGATLCAERVAIGGLVASGERKLFVIAVYVEAPRLAMPCGICRQTIVEFGPAATVIVANQDQSMVVPIEELLPKPFVFDPTD